VTTSDLIEYGMEAEFVGRLPVRVACEELTASDLRKILSESEGSVLRQYERAFLAFGIEAVFDDAALDRIAELAAEEGTGARGLLTVCERLLRDFKFELPGSGVTSLRVDMALIERPSERLAQLRASGEDERVRVLRRSAEDFVDRLGQSQGVALKFSPEALDLLVEMAVARQQPVRELCAELFKDYEFGLRLVKRPSADSPVILPREAVEAPDKFLSDLVVRAYRSSPSDEPPAGPAS
jgi:ATP-dependent protease Clp ATPase subunit